MSGKGDTPEYVHKALAAKYGAEADRATAEANKSQAEAELNQLAVELTTFDLESKRRMEESVLALDEFHHVFRFHAPVTDSSVEKIMDRFTHWHRISDEPLNVKLQIYSPGGGIVSGNALFDFLQEWKGYGHHLTTVSRGYAASMGGIILQAGHVRQMGKESWMLIHEGSGGAQGSVGEIEDTVEWHKKMVKRFAEILAERSTMTVKQIERKWHRTDWWLDAQEALDLKLIDEIV